MTRTDKTYKAIVHQQVYTQVYVSAGSKAEAIKKIRSGDIFFKEDLARQAGFQVGSRDSVEEVHASRRQEGRK